MPETDKRNLVDEFKGLPNEQIVATLDTRGHQLEVAIENLAHDFNMGTIVRNANAFGVRKVHIVGKKQWNKRGAMVTNRYLHVYHYQTVDEFINYARKAGLELVAIENNTPRQQPLSQTALPKNCILLFGSESNGLSQAMLDHANQVVAIEQFGSTRSVNVGVASGIAMYAWLQRHVLHDAKI